MGVGAGGKMWGALGRRVFVGGERLSGGGGSQGPRKEGGMGGLFSRLGRFGASGGAQWGPWKGPGTLKKVQDLSKRFLVKAPFFREILATRWPKPS